METFSTRQSAVIASATKTVYWEFRITDNQENPNTYYWSTGTVPSVGDETILSGARRNAAAWMIREWNREHTFKIINFGGITLRRGKSEAGIHAPNDVSFSIVNSSNAYDAVNFRGGEVRIALVINDGNGREVCGSWRFRIKSASPYNQQIEIVCEDFLQQYLKGSYPNTKLINQIFPNTYDANKTDDGMCVPEPYGTCYIPLRPVYAADDRYYLLGDTTNTYTITKVRSPRSMGTKIEWDSGSFSFTQSTKADAGANNWRVFQPIIADSNLDGTVDANGIWLSGSGLVDMPTKFSRSDTASITSPADIIRYVLRNMGVLDYDLDIASFHTARATYASWGLAWNFAFWYKQDRKKVLANLLAMCHSCLVVGERISLQVLSATSQDTIDETNVMSDGETGPPKFQYTDSIAEVNSDSGYVAWQQTGESQDEFLRALVPAKSTTDTIDQEVLQISAVQDSQQIQKLGTLYYQRKFLKSADISTTAKGLLLALRPDDVVTISNADYFGGTYNVLVDEVQINPDTSIGLKCIKFSEVLDDWEDLAPGAITVGTDAPSASGSYSPVIAGPDAPGAPNLPNALPGRLRVGQTTNYILLEPASPLRISLYSADVERIRLGNLNGFLDYVTGLYGLAIGDSSNYLKYDTTNGLRISGAISAGTIDIGGADATSFHVDTNGNMWLGAATFDIATNPFAVSSAGVLRAVSGTIGGFTLAATTLTATNLTLDAANQKISLGTGTDIITIDAADATYRLAIGHSTYASAPFRVTKAGLLTAISGTVGGFTLAATTLTGTNLTLDAGNQKITLGTGTDIAILDAADATYRLAIGHSTYASAPFRVSKAGALTASSATITGSITATSGAIANFTVATDSLTSTLIGLHSAGYTEGAELLLGHATLYASAKVGLKADGSGKLASGNIAWDTAGNITSSGAWTSTHTITGGTIQTAAAGARSVLSSTGLAVYDATTQRAKIGSDGAGWLGASDIISWTSAGAVSIAGFGATSSALSVAAGGNTTTISASGTNAFIAGTTGAPTVSISHAGVLTATGASISGTLTASAGTIGGFTLSSTALYAGSVATRIQLDTSAGIHLGATAFADAPFKVSLAGALTATNATISGAVSAATIDIGGDDATSFHVDIDGGLWSGSSIANKATAPFRVSNSGALVATSATITGSITASSGSVGSFTIGTYLYTGSKTAYNDANAGVHLGSDGIGIGNNVFTVSSAGALVATSATITGVITATSGTFTGTINATAGKFGTATNYWSVGATGLTAVSASTDVMINYGKTDWDNTQNGFILGYDFSASKAKFYVGDSDSYLNWDGSALTYTKGTLVETIIQMYTSVASLKTSATAGDGSVNSSGIVVTYEGIFGCGASQTATVAAANANVRILADGSAYFSGTVTSGAGSIGGFTIGTDYIKDTADSFGLASTVTGGDDVRFWAGDTFANRATADFRITEAGSLYASSATISGIISGSYVYGSSLMTKGTYLTSSLGFGDTTINVGDTTDFPASGTASFIDSGNDRDYFTYTGKTATTLTGCSGHTIPHSISTRPLVVPSVKGIYISDSVNDIRIFGDNGYGTIEEIFSVGLLPDSYTGIGDVVMDIGSLSSNNIPLRIRSKDSISELIYAYGIDSDSVALNLKASGRLTEDRLSNTIDALDILSVRNSETDSYRMYGVYGIYDEYGHTSNAHTSVVTDIVCGLRLAPYSSKGTITTLYDIRIDSPFTGGTITNHYAIYQEDTAATNYFAGYTLANGGIRVGTTATDPGDNNFYVEGTSDFGGVSTFTNTGLHILDTNASHDLIIKPGSDLTADRILTLTTGDAARTLTINGDATINDWFDQSVKAAASPSFTAITIGSGNSITGHLTLLTTYDCPSVSGYGGISEASIGLTGAAVGDTVTVSPSTTIESGLIVTGFATTDSITLRFTNCTTGFINPASRNYRIDVWKH